MNEHDALDLPSRLLSLVVKDGVALGGLPAPQQAVALVLVWAGLPDDGGCNEPQINQRLKAQLAGPAACLDTDHVELRRWLVDAGWLQRDGFGRVYRRVPVAELPAAQAGLAAAMGTLFGDRTPLDWVAGQRAARAKAREVRRRNWLAASAGRAADGAAGAERK